MLARRALLTLVLAAVLATPALVAAQDEGGRPPADGAPPPCDVDRDGTINETEGERCPRIVDRCDTDDDSMVDDDEREACGEAIEERCDTNHDGRVGDVERRQCANPGDGTHGDPRPMPCDTDRDGRVDDVERRQCANGGPDHPPGDDHNEGDHGDDGHDEGGHDGAQDKPRGPPPMSEECRAALEEQRSANDEFRASMEAERREFREGQDAQFREFSAEEHTEEEWQEFREQMDAERREAESGFEADRRAFEEDSRENAADCQGHVGAGGNDCRPDEATFQRFRNYMDEEETKFRGEVDARRERFAQHQAAAIEALGDDATDEEKTELREKLARERHAFDRELQSAIEQRRSAMERQWEEFKQKALRACVGHDAPRDFREVQQDSRGLRLECGLDIQQTFDAFYQANGRDASNWTDEQTSDFIRLRGDAQRARDACEGRIHDEWKAEARERFEERGGHERFGSFEVDGDNGSGHASGRFVAFDYEVGSLTIRDYTVQGALLFTEFYAPHDITGPPRADGAVLKLDGRGETGGLGVRITDNPTGSFDVVCGPPGSEDSDDDVAGAPDACLLTFDDAATIDERDDGEGPQARYTIEVGNRSAILMLHGPHSWEENSVEFRGGLRLFSPSENFVLAKVANKEREKIDAAIEKRSVLAEVTITLGEDDEPVAEFTPLDSASTRDESEDDDTSACDAGGDGAVKFELDGLKCGVVRPLEEGTGIDVVISAESDEPKTLVFNLDIGLFKLDEGQTLDASEFQIDYYDVDGEGKEVKVDITEADDISDVLDPAEDAPEYWIVLDDDGLQLLVSNAHFSTKRITVASAEAPEGDGGETTATPPATTSGGASASAPTPGLGIFALVAALSAVALSLRRRG